MKPDPEYCRIGEEAVYSALINYFQKEDRSEEIHVTDLVGYCLRQAYFNKKYGTVFTMEQMARMVCGVKMHEIDIFPDTPGSMEIPVQLGPIRGHVDHFKDGIIYDKKYSSSEHKSASQYVKNQINYYAAMLRQDNYPVTGGVVLYIHPTDGKVVSYPIEMRPHVGVVEEMMSKAQILESCMKVDMPPARQVGWWCNNCPQLGKCYGRR